MMKKLILLMVLIVSLFSFNGLFVSALECSCTWDNELLMWLPDPGYCTGGCQYAVCGGSGPTDCSCELINRDYDWYACKNCGLDSTSGDDGIGYGSYLFGIYGDPNCCGDDISEYYTELFFDSGACCNEVTDCALGDGNCLNSQSASGTKLCSDRTIYDYVEDKFVDYDPFESGEVGACGVSGSWDTSCDCNDYHSVCEASVGCGGSWIPADSNPLGNDNVCCTGSVEAIYEEIYGGYYDPVTGWHCGTLDLGSSTDCILDGPVIPW